VTLDEFNALKELQVQLKDTQLQLLQMLCSVNDKVDKLLKDKQDGSAHGDEKKQAVISKRHPRLQFPPLVELSEQLQKMVKLDAISTNFHNSFVENYNKLLYHYQETGHCNIDPQYDVKLVTWLKNIKMHFTYMKNGEGRFSQDNRYYVLLRKLGINRGTPF
jgi:hypothetical protein